MTFPHTGPLGLVGAVYLAARQAASVYVEGQADARAKESGVLPVHEVDPSSASGDFVWGSK